jgi:ATP synthase protein I
MSGNSSKPDPSFEERLQAARQRQGLEKPAVAQAAVDSKGLGFGLRAGMELVAAELVAGVIGWGLDSLLHTLPLFLVIFVLLGGAAGVMNVLRQFARADSERRQGPPRGQ